MSAAFMACPASARKPDRLVGSSLSFRSPLSCRSLCTCSVRSPFGGSDSIPDRACRCRRRLDPFSDHGAACARAGLLRNRGCPLERIAARVCREAGARVTVNSCLADMNLLVDRLDDRRLEVLWNGAQVAVDTTLVSSLSSSGEPRRHAGRVDGAALRGPPPEGAHLPGAAALPAVPPCRACH